ncbi:hypothetical protein [Pedobacter sp. UC225_65]|uniref:hypothetical protein n=1 Tax=Pedobacter sp. UC225_65 TaxID=3350173 RepID=UPI003671FAFB
MSIQATPIKRDEHLFEFSICTLVTRRAEYNEMVQSFNDSGFTDNLCEYLFADNTDGNLFDAYEAFNVFLRQAKGKYIIVCHQDILINEDDISDLRNKLDELDAIDSNWAICSNSGAAGPNHIVYHISYPNKGLMSKGRFPLKVNAIDENFILVKNTALLKVSNDVNGFHLYGTDLCLQAELNGFSAYAIAFNLTHKSFGNRDEAFYRIKKELVKKYDSFFRSRWVQTNNTIFFLSGSQIKFFLRNPISLFFIRMFNSLKKKF